MNARKSVLIIASVGCVLWSIGQGVPAQDKAEEISPVKNASFEEGGKQPTEWIFDQSLASKGTLSVSTEFHHDGKVGLCLTPTAKNDDVSKPLAVVQILNVSGIKAKRLHLSGWMAARDRARGVIGIVAMTKAGKALSVFGIEQRANEGGLVFREDTFRVPDDPDLDRLVVFCAVMDTSGAAYFDDIAIDTKIPVHPSAQFDPGPPLTAKVEVDATQELRTIPRTLYGTNVEWNWNGQGLWEPEKNDFHPVILEKTKSLGVTLLRFPGGVLSDFYHWKDGIGPQTDRRVTEPIPGDEKSKHVIGSDEMIDLAKKVDAELLFTVNAGTGTAQEAADWMTYMKPKANVAFWEIGNEIYLDDGGKVAKAIAIPASKYADKCAEFIQAMRKVDPKAKIGAIGNHSFWMNGEKEWDSTVLAKVGKDIDFLAIHNAYAPMMFNDTGQSAREVYAGLLAAPLLVREDLDQVSDEIMKLGSKDADRIKIAVTEWGTLFHTQPTSPWVDHCKTLGSALYTASVMKAFIENPRVEMANHFKLVDPLFIGSIGLREGQYAETAPYYALQMYMKHFGTVLVESVVTCPSYTSPAVGAVRSVKDVPYLEVISSKSADGKKLYILAINKHFDRDIKAELSMKGFKSRDQGTVWCLNGDGIDAHTGTAPLKVPGFIWGKQIEADPLPQFSKGNPSAITMKNWPFVTLGKKMTFTFPAHSVICIEVRGGPDK